MLGIALIVAGSVTVTKAYSDCASHHDWKCHLLRNENADTGWESIEESDSITEFDSEKQCLGK